MADQADNRIEDRVDYAVVGAGISGAYCAWRLKEAYPDKRVALFEHSSRIGGRLFTVRLPDAPDLNAELGGMRYLPEQHPLFHAIVEQFHLATRPFPMGGAKDPSGQNNFVYFRGQNLFIKDMNDSNLVPFRVNWAERNLNPDALQAQVMRTLVPNWSELDFKGWFEVEIFGKKLWEYGFWNLLYRVLSPDAFFFLKYGSGYDTNVSNGNAVTLLPTGGDYSSTNQYMTVWEGMEAVPRKLAEDFRDTHKGDLRINWRLASIRRREDALYTLRFFRTRTLAGRTKDVEPAEARDVVAQHVVLAMPRRSLEMIDWECWTTNPFLRENLGSVLIQAAFKIFLTYDYPWWRALGLTAGRSITDVPLRQTYYFTAPEDADPNKPPRSPGLLMAGYNDIESIPFWKGLERGKSFPGPAEACATELMVQEAHRQVLELHGARELPLPREAAYHDWSDDPYGGGWHCWKAGFKYVDLMDKMRHPVESENVYICGEAYSADQGWAEGALETAELLLTRDLQVPAHKVSRGWHPRPLKRLYY